MSENIDLLLENQSLKNEFVIRNLDLSQVFSPTPDNLERENRFLKDLLDWVNRYSECRDRKIMEKEGYDFPPIEPGISPENDWYLFERWMNGKSIRMKVKDCLIPYHSPKDIESLDENEIKTELQKLNEHLEKNRISFEFNKDVPLRLVYIHLFEMLDEEFERISEGCWHLDGCSGYCPDCFQRPWCETGCDSCWKEDEEAGKMFLIDTVKKYVSPSPVSLIILKKRQEEHDKAFEEFQKNQKDSDTSIDLNSFDFDEDDDLPF